MQITVQFRRKRVFGDIRLIVLLALVLVIISWIDIYREGFYLLAPIFVFLFSFITYPWLWRFFCLFWLHQPALIVNNIGVQLSPIYIPGNFFINWSEIQKICIEKYYSEDCICIHHRNENEYLARFSSFKRLMIRLRKPQRGVVLYIPLSYLDIPIMEIFQRISQEYPNELYENNIQLQI
jgi:hypothetical protein